MFILIVIAGLSFYFYTKADTMTIPPTSPEEILNRSIFVQAFSGEESIPVTFDIFLDDIFYQSYQGQQGNYLKIDLPVNKSIIILTKSQTYYNQKFEAQREFLLENNRRIDLNLTKFPNIIINQSISFRQGRNFYLTVNSSEPISKVLYCFTWGPRILRVSTDLPSIQLPTEYDHIYNRCFSSSLEGYRNLTMTVSYETIGEISESDFIRLIIIDSDICFKDATFMQCTFNQKDVGIANPVFNLT